MVRCPKQDPLTMVRQNLEGVMISIRCKQEILIISVYRRKTSEEATDVGPLVNEPTRTKVAELVESAAPGGKVLAGGRAPERRGYFYQPTLIDQVPADAGILGTEIFGPVAPVVRFSAEADAVRRRQAVGHRP